MSDLKTLQSWLSSIIIQPGAVSYKIDAADEQFDLHHRSVVRKNDLLKSEEQISIYSRGYVLRLLECMRADYPVLEKHLGSALFNTFVHAYLVHHPPVSYSLYALGKNFPDFLEASRPDRNDKNILFEMPVALARLERAKAEVYRSKGSESNENKFHSTLPDWMFFSDTQYATNPCLQLLQSAFPLLEFIRSIEQDVQSPLPHPQLTYLAVCRKNYSVTTHEIEAWQWHFLNFLSEKNDQADALRRTSELTLLPEENLLAELLLWMPVAIGHGFIVD